MTLTRFLVRSLQTLDPARLGGLCSIAICSLHGCYVCVGHGKMIAVEYEEEEWFFHQRVILRTGSKAAMFNTTGRMCDSPFGLFSILTPDGDVFPERLRVPPAEGLQVVAMNWIFSFRIEFARVGFIFGPHQWWAATGGS